MSAAEVEFLLHQQPLQMLPACYLGQAGERGRAGAGEGRGRGGGRVEEAGAKKKAAKSEGVQKTKADK